MVGTIVSFLCNAVEMDVFFGQGFRRSGNSVDLLRNAICGCSKGTTSLLRFECGWQSDSIPNASATRSAIVICYLPIRPTDLGDVILTACVEVASKVREAVEEGRQRSVLKTTAPQVLSNFDSTTTWQPASLIAAPAVGHTVAPEVAA